jgi:hypothetical protein
MEFPPDIQILINDYARPTTRLDWMKGSYIHRRVGNRATTLKGYLHVEVVMRAVKIAKRSIEDPTRDDALFYFNDLLAQHGEDIDD